MLDLYALTEELIPLLRAHHLEAWAIKFEEAMAGSTGSEIQMALRWHSKALMKARKTMSSKILQIAKEIYQETDRNLKSVDKKKS